MDGKAVASSTSQSLTEIVGRGPDSVTRNDLPAKVGAATSCKLVDGADTSNVAITTTTVKRTNVTFDIKVGDAPE